jgi:hypothetical protein
MRIFLFSSLFILFASFSSAQILIESEVFPGLCNNSLSEPDPFSTPCIQNVPAGTTTVRGKLGDDDGEDNYIFPAKTVGTYVISFTLVQISGYFGTPGMLLKIKEYTGTVLTSTYSEAASTTVPNGGSFTFDINKKYILVAEREGSAFDYTITFNRPLPVSFSAFNIKNKINSIELNWNTGFEENTEHFNIKRSTDGLSFESIGSLSANGWTKSQSKYSFVDLSPNLGVNYYQIIAKDYDSRETYSKILSTQFLSSETKTLLYPNPSNGEINLKSSKNIEEIELLSLDGKSLLKLSPQTIHNLKSAAAGRYYLKIKYTDSNTECLSWVKE